MIACFESYVVVLGISSKIFMSQIHYRESELNFFVKDSEFFCVSGINKHWLVVKKDGCVFVFRLNNCDQLGFHE